MIRALMMAIVLTFSLEAATVIKEYRYTASDTDSKVSARKAALETVKNMVMDELGTGVSTRFEKNQKIEDKQVEQQMRLSIKNFASGFVQSKVLDERWDGTSYWIKASVTMDETGLYEKVMQQYTTILAGAKSRLLETMLADISTTEKQHSLVKKAVTHPFSDDENGAVHLKIIHTFERYKVYDPIYRTFLMTTLQTIEYPSWDERVIPILKYMTHFPSYSEAEQKTLLGILLNVKVRDGGQYLSIMLKPMIQSCDKGTEELMGDYLSQIRQGKAGLPVYTNLSNELRAIVSGWSDTVNPSCPMLGSKPLLKAIRSDDARGISLRDWMRILESLAGISGENPAVSVKDLAPFIKEVTPHLTADNYGKQMIETLFQRVDPSLRIALAAEIVEDIRRVLAPQKLYASDIVLCVKLGVTIPDQVFTLSEYYDRVMRSAEASDLANSVEAIIAYGEANGGKNHEKFLEMMRFLDAKREHYFADKMVPIMEKIGYEDQASINLLFGFISSDNPNISRKASKMLLATDHPNQRIEAAVVALRDFDVKRQTRLITFLVKYGKATASILPVLDSYKAKDKELKYAAEWLEKELKKQGYL